MNQSPGSCNGCRLLGYAGQHRFIRIQEPARLGVIIPALEVIKPCFGIVIIPAVTKRIQHPDRIRKAARDAEKPAPCIIILPSLIDEGR